MRPKHPNKDIEAALKYAEENDWRYQSSGKSSHAWGKMLYPEKSREGCRLSVWSTPKSPVNHARQIIKKVDQCIHEAENDEEPSSNKEDD